MVIGKRLLIRFLIQTFLLTYLCWGVIIAANQFGLLKFYTPFGMLLFIVGTWSPTIFSYICMKQNGTICGIKDFVKIAFSFKQNFFCYIIVFTFLLLFYLPLAIHSGTKTDAAWYLLFTFFPLMVIDGGMEELGWRYLLQPTLEKHFSFVISTVITAGIWLIWHLPLFFIAGSGQNKMPFILFVIFIFGVSFALAAIYRISQNVWLCIMFHALINALAIYWSVAQETIPTLIGSASVVVMAIAVIVLHKNKSKGGNKTVHQL